RVLGGEEALTLEEALSAYSLNGAYGSFSEKQKGKLTPGYLADIAVFDKDIFSCQAEELLECNIDLTLLGGEVVFDRLGEA
ncbi:MAG: amidohydrolase family protein, partial [Kiloniellales bacterium]|nr:amidohydrolase family protein [Kiloniellales bacterium]